MRQFTYEVRSKEEYKEKLSFIKEELNGGNYSDCLVNLFPDGFKKEEIENILNLTHEMIPQMKHVGIPIHKMGDDRTKKLIKVSFQLFNTSKVRVIQTEYKDDCPIKTSKSLIKAIEEADDLVGVGLYPSVSFIDISEVIERVSEGREELPFFGAQAYSENINTEMTSIDNDAARWLYVIGNKVSSTGIVAVLYCGKELHISNDYILGWKPIGKEMDVEIAKNHYVGLTTISKIDGIRAVDIYDKYLGVQPSKDLIYNVCEFPLYTERDGCPLTRVPFMNDEHGCIHLIGNVKEGEKIRFSYGNRAEILSASKTGAEHLREFNPESIMLFVCGNRTIFLKDMSEMEIDFFRDVHSETIACHGLCELYRQGGNGGVLNSSIVAVGMREGGDSCPPSCRIPEKLRMKPELKNGEIIPLEARLVRFLEAMTSEYERMALEADSSNRAKSAFLSNMSHEIRTPINVVLGMDEMILRETKEEEIKNYATDIYTSGQTLLSLINDILDFSKIESGKMEIVPVEYDFSSLIHDMENMARVRAGDKGLKFELEVESDLPSRMYGDDIRVRQVITNILTNAVKYTEEGTVWFRVSGRTNGDVETLHFEIEDTGIGIKEEDLPKLFEKFQRIEEDRNRSIEGTGLGMSITTLLLKLMGSSINVDSVYGKGSKFYFDIDQKIVDDTPIGDFAERVSKLSDIYHHEETFVAPNAKVLVVDDNDMNRKVFVRLLRDTEIQIDQAKSGFECLEMSAKKRYDIIFLDHMMPEMDGIETLEKMQEETDSPNADTPIFMLTANAVEGAKEQYLSVGFTGFISKPIDSVLLEQTIKETLPDELLEPVKRKESVQDRTDEKSEVIASLPVIAGVDWDIAWMHLPGRDILETGFDGFYSLIDNQADKLEKMYEAIQEAVNGDDSDLSAAVDEYRIQVHGMKSSAATVGITPLSGMAQTLEYAARDNKIDIIDSMTWVLLSEWRSYKDKLMGLFDLGKKTEAEDEIDPAMFSSYLKSLDAAMDDFDIDKADEIVARLREYRFENKAADLIKKLAIAVSDLDGETVKTITNDLLQAF